MNHQSVYAIATSDGQAKRIVANLTRAGFPSNDISALFPYMGTSHDFSYEKDTKAPEGAVIGGTLGLLVGLLIGLLIGIGALAIPGVGPLLVVGPFLAALTGAAAGAAVGGLAGGLVGMGIPEIEARRCENRSVEGNIHISVYAETGDEVARAKEILDEAAAEEIFVTSNHEVAG